MPEIEVATTEFGMGFEYLRPNHSESSNIQTFSIIADVVQVLVSSSFEF